ncbi:MAG: hypothetical protein COV55_04440 [Candidatus Komeilibacteria bacterium CG11_big_fil_rev_8_21_14_0_20_36_20]|uniref:Methyltransferase type 11 domain-containing protein n=1 Tax=Candidatus Komeilibacteria bacterium CG11_big_fil_rev_8_21_14_0_20_36_20 TaxID=1974477 RepID=A0A2H0NBJ5_9BACT|nr:MAG: hypothetical protein COV55_04440 [Candidatus Komeilibacteria bacterium CG11_big_fil_rev_8_21_14_0_20_36_20]PIR81699.1 MAG: hypothetical protein COU21_02005 [Candidatus Komeilibacteria bacterium CG10_big_fil_rev_8_21_14_0_10_36_65]PJC54898.1 MAG: hypothetical protein CO027_04820 [Candidatus Komeilibacteria bacterium CG_4_9_14_0_2_um_filter_36_13]
MKKNTYAIKSQEQKDFYNQTAQQYNQWHVQKASAQIVDAWNFDNLKKFLRNNHKITRCLDLGCGTGRLSNKLLKIADEVYGIDQSIEVLKIAQKKYPHLKLTCGEVVNLTYQDNFFDLVIINGSLHHFFAVEKTLTEAQRVLKKGGYFVLLGEPNANYLKFFNPFFYLWIINRLIFKFFNLFKEKKEIDSRLIEPAAEKYNPSQLKKQIINSGFGIKKFYTYDYFHRSENRLLLKFYHSYLNFEHKFIAPIFKNMGSAIQCFAIKR